MEPTQAHSGASATPTPTPSRDETCASFEDCQREKESWSLVRETLIKTPKFTKAAEDISETEWQQARGDSMKTILNACSNFHGGPKGEMWTTITSVVSHHMGPQHEFLTLISEHQENLWTTCSLVTVTTFSEDASMDETRESVEDDTVNQLYLSVASLSPRREYGSIELIEPAGKGDMMCACIL